MPTMTTARGVRITTTEGEPLVHVDHDTVHVRLTSDEAVAAAAQILHRFSEQGYRPDQVFLSIEASEGFYPARVFPADAPPDTAPDTADTLRTDTGRTETGDARERAVAHVREAVEICDHYGLDLADVIDEAREARREARREETP